VIITEPFTLEPLLDEYNVNVVAFAQDDATREVGQAAIADLINTMTGIGDGPHPYQSTWGAIKARAWR
jgi:hypothetical protein